MEQNQRRTCAGTSRLGERCRRLAAPGEEYCAYHGAQGFENQKRRPYAASARPFCGATTAHGDPCRNRAVPGRTRCKFHGGHTPIGPANPLYKHGRYSKYLNSIELSRHRELLNDATLLELREEIAIVTRHLGEIEAELNRDDLDPRLRQRLEQRQERLLELRARLGDAELRRLQVQQHLVPRGQVLVLIQHIAAVLKEELDDETLGRVLNRLLILLRSAGYEPLSDRETELLNREHNRLVAAGVLPPASPPSPPPAGG